MDGLEGLDDVKLIIGYNKFRFFRGYFFVMDCLLKFVFII